MPQKSSGSSSIYGRYFVRIKYFYTVLVFLLNKLSELTFNIVEYLNWKDLGCFINKTVFEILVKYKR